MLVNDRDAILRSRVDSVPVPQRWSEKGHWSVGSGFHSRFELMVEERMENECEGIAWTKLRRVSSSENILRLRPTGK